MEDDTLASGCAGGAGGGGSTGDGGSVDGRYDACSALHEHVDGVDLCAGSDGDGGDDAKPHTVPDWGLESASSFRD